MPNTLTEELLMPLATIGTAAVATSPQSRHTSATTTPMPTSSAVRGISPSLLYSIHGTEMHATPSIIQPTQAHTILSKSLSVNVTPDSVSTQLPPTLSNTRFNKRSLVIGVVVGLGVVSLVTVLSVMALISLTYHNFHKHRKRKSLISYRQSRTHVGLGKPRLLTRFKECT